MPLGWILGKSYRVKCPDGSTKTVYRNVNDAFPLSIDGWKGDLAAEAKGVAGEAAKIKGAYATKVQGLLFGLDELTQTLVLNYRSVYMVYVSDPCGNAGFFQREVQKLVAEQQRIARLRIQVRTLIEIAKVKTVDAGAFLDLFRELAGGVGGSSIPAAVEAEILEARQIADRWAGGE